jgi:hypothetical protein
MIPYIGNKCNTFIRLFASFFDEKVHEKGATFYQYLTEIDDRYIIV